MKGQRWPMKSRILFALASSLLGKCDFGCVSKIQVSRHDSMTCVCETVETHSLKKEGSSRLGNYRRLSRVPFPCDLLPTCDFQTCGRFAE
mmetsp:Transcript_18314/g.33205  ORF Transcript_18314/g.33205 Transcript_18314/m.33205 type:complete len:90 (-) Transcript_18314:338-607(-)